MFHKFQITLVTCVSTLVVILPTTAKAVNLVRNGSFEKSRLSPRTLFYPVFPEQTTLRNWTVQSSPASMDSGEGSSIDILRDYAPAADGRQSLDLSGYDAGAIYQDLSTEIGRTYNLSFDFAGNPDSNVKQMEVVWGDRAIGIFSFDTSTGGTNGEPTTVWDMGWVTKTVQLPAATASITRLGFISLTPGLMGPVLDNVSVTSGDLTSNPAGIAVPEPSSILGVLALGTLSAGSWLKKRRKSKKCQQF